MTPAMWASAQGHLEIIQYLVREAGSSLTKHGDPQNIYGGPMHLACLVDNVEMFAYLCNEK